MLYRKREEITGDSRNCDESFSQKSGKSQECEEEHSATKTTTATRAGGALKKKRSDAEEKGNAESNGKICIVTRSTKSTKSVKVESNGGSNSKSNPAGSDA